MAQVTLYVNGKPYLVGCEDGDEQRLESLAADFDAKVRSLGVGAALGETRLILMGALMLADEAVAMADRVAAAESEAERLRGLLAVADSRAATALEAAARKIEGLAAR